MVQRLAAHTQGLIGRFWRLELLSRADLFIVQQLVPMCYISRFSHLLRYHAPSLIVEAAREFDALTMALVEVFFKIDALTPEQCTRASLPRRLGGWALREGGVDGPARAVRGDAVPVSLDGGLPCSW